MRAYDNSDYDQCILHLLGNSQSSFAAQLYGRD
jgi:hypothetical protein